MELSEDDVLHILKLIDESTFDYFQLEMGDLKITVSKGEPLPLASAPQTSAASQAPSAAPAQAPKAAPPPQAAKAEPKTAAAIPEGLLPITAPLLGTDRKSTRLNSSHQIISYAVFCLKKKNKKKHDQYTI